MDLKEFGNVDSLYRDLDTGQEVEWHDYMARVIGKLGAENIKPYIPYPLSYLKEKLKDDIHLNNTEMARWDFAGGFLSDINKKTKVKEYRFAHSGLTYFLAKNGITCMSPAECVCILKETARILIAKEENDA